MSVTDIVTTAVEHLDSKVKNVQAVKNKTIYAYGQEQLLAFESKVNTPCVGVLYIRTVKVPTKSQFGGRRERAYEIICDVVLLGGDTCDSNASSGKESSTQILADIRDEILNPENKVEGDLNWVFETEEPIHIATAVNQELFGYVQQWSVIFTWDETNGWTSG